MDCSNKMEEIWAENKILKTTVDSLKYATIWK
jgi:hypothetical protein